METIKINQPRFFKYHQHARVYDSKTGRILPSGHPDIKETVFPREWAVIRITLTTGQIAEHAIPFDYWKNPEAVADVLCDAWEDMNDQLEDHE